MATLIFLISLVFYTVYFTSLTNNYFMILWFLGSLPLSFLTMLIFYFLNFPLVVLLPSKHPYKSYMMRSLAYFLNHFILNLKVSIDGLENLPKDGPLVIYANHKSYTDAFAILEVLPRAITLTPKKSVMKLPLINLWLKAYNVFPINRNNPRETAFELEKAVETVKSGHAVLIFPEGNIGNRLDPNVKSMKPGAFKLAIKAAANILVVRYDGNDLLRKRAPFKRSRRKLTLMKLIHFDEIKDFTTHQIAELVMSRINAKHA